MGNILDQKTIIGTMGELLAQLRLLQYGVQAAPPLKDSGNDLIAIKGWQARYVQVKTTTKDRFNLNKLPDIYHFVLFIKLNDNLQINQPEIFLLTKSQINQKSYTVSSLRSKECIFCKDIVDKVFKN